MGYRDCLACKEAGTKPKRGLNVRLVFDPRITMPGSPTLEGHGLGAEFMAKRVYALGLRDQIDDYELTREQLLVCCWWAGTYGPRSLKKAFGTWAKTAGWHLWHGCINVEDPPLRESEKPGIPAALGASRGQPDA